MINCLFSKKVVLRRLLKFKDQSCYMFSVVKNISIMDCKPMSLTPFTVFVEGNIGSGKTTFLNHFLKHDALVLAEPVELWRNVRGHNMLELMYNDPAKWSLAFQSYVQKTMLDFHIRQTTKSLKMMERSIYSARYCFVENLHRNKLLASPDYAVLDEWFQWIIKHMNTKGHLTVYLRTDPEVVYRRIKERAREEEVQVTLNYLEQLHEMHEDWLFKKTAFHCPTPVIVVDANKELTSLKEEFEKFALDMMNKAALYSAQQIVLPTMPLYQQTISQSPTKVQL